MAVDLYVNVPVGIISILMVIFISGPPMKKMKMKIDYWGLALLAIGLGCLQIVLDKDRGRWFSSALSQC